MLMSDAMKFASNAASALAAALGSLGDRGHWVNRAQSGNQSRRRAALRPTGLALRNPADPFQQKVMLEAIHKRERKAFKLQADYDRSWSHNYC